ncbi:hypothetical protein GN286_16625 [Rhodobacteraceae bacterium IMCC15231]|nr:hypothetical protein [Rhodobacteraceae bacterium IMCC15231]
MSDDVTILTSTTHTSIVKTFSGIDLTEQAFATGKEVNVTEEPVSDLQSLSKLMQRLENSPTQTIIRGLQTEGKTNPALRNKDTWLCQNKPPCLTSMR